MKKMFMLAVLSLTGLLGLGAPSAFVRGQEPISENQAALPETEEYSESVDIDCGGSADLCDPCAPACSVGCYGDCVGYGGCGMYGGCGLGIFPFVQDVASVALTPVHWVASLLSCNTWADCGCAPLPCRSYCDPCDTCGNWVGCEYCGGAGCTACAGEQNFGKWNGVSGANETMLGAKSDYLNYNNVETIHQRKTRLAHQTPAQGSTQGSTQVPRQYQYSEEILEGAAVPPSRSAKKVAAVPAQNHSTQQKAAVGAVNQKKAPRTVNKGQVRQATMPNARQNYQNYQNVR